jgi:hypothetical protein
LGSVIFVHGTGVREDSYKKSISQIGKKLLAKRADLTLIPCFWGDKLGANAIGTLHSLPDADTPRSPENLTDENYDTGIWGLLYNDPLYELRILGLQPKQTDGALPPNQLSSYQQLDEAVKKIESEGELLELLRTSGLDAIWPEAIQAVISSKDYFSALNNAPAATDEYRQAIARALVGQSILIARDRWQTPDDESPISAQDRDRLTERLLEQLGTHRGALGWMAKQVIGWPATFFVRRNRAAYSEAAYPGFGDILLYQARGKAIRDLIREKVTEAKPPVILLAHSLGGIACVDLLIMESLPEVELLITAGSQSPLLYEIGALYSLERGNPLPGHFPKQWLNLYDPRDFLGYLAGPVFPKHPERTIADIRINNREPFPQAHTSYWDNDQVWDAIDEKISEVIK